MTPAEFGPTEIATVSRWTGTDLVSGTCVSGINNGEFQEMKYF